MQFRRPAHRLLRMLVRAATIWPDAQQCIQPRREGRQAQWRQLRRQRPKHGRRMLLLLVVVVRLLVLVMWPAAEALVGVGHAWNACVLRARP